MISKVIPFFFFQLDVVDSNSQDLLQSLDFLMKVLPQHGFSSVFVNFTDLKLMVFCYWAQYKHFYRNLFDPPYIRFDDPLNVLQFIPSEKFVSSMIEKNMLVLRKS